MDLAPHSGSENPLDLFVAVRPGQGALSPNPSVARIQYPNHYVDEHWDGPPYEFVGSKDYYYGFWGPGANLSRKACFPVAPVTLENMFLSPNGDPLHWTGISGGGVRVASGGVPNGNCAGAPYVDRMDIFPASLKNRDPLRFAGPYRTYPNSQWDQYLKFDYESGSQKLTVKWKYLPGMFNGSAPLSGSSIYLHKNWNSNNDIHSGEPGQGNCDEFLRSFDFVRVGSVDGANAESFVISNIPQSLIEDNKIEVAICPYRGSKYFTNFVRAHGVSNVLGGSLSFKITGNNPSQTDYWNGNSYIPSGGIRLIKDKVINGYHNLFISYGNNFLQPNDVSQVEFTLDNGLSWQQIGSDSPSLAASGASYAGVSLGSTIFSTAVGGPATKEVKFRVSLTNPESFEQSDEFFISGPVTLVGSSDCSAPALRLQKSNGTLLSLGEIFTDIVAPTPGVTNATDISETYKLVWSGSPACGNAIAVVDHLELDVPPTCLALEEDIFLDPLSPFSLRIDPKDRTGGDCSFGAGQTFQIVTPSSGDAEKISQTLTTSDFLIHSTNYSSLSFYLTDATPPTNLSSLRLKLKTWFTSAGRVLEGLVVKANSDGVILDRNSASYEPSAATWNVTSNHISPSNFVPASLSQLTAQASPANRSMQIQSVMDGASTGKFYTLNHNLLDQVVYVSRTHFWGSSRLIVAKDESNNAFVRFHPKNYENPVGNEIKTLGGLSIQTTNPVVAESVGQWGDFALVAVAYDNKLYLGAVKHSDYSVIWSNPITLTDATYVLGQVYDYGGALRVFANASATSLKIYDVGMPTFNGVSWSTPGSLASIETESGFDAFRFGTCGKGFYFIAGKGSSGEAVAHFYGSSGQTMNWDFTTDPSVLSAHGNAGCFVTRPTGAGEFFTMTFFDPNASTSSVGLVSVNYNAGSSSQCSLDPAQFSVMSPPAIGGTGPILDFGYATNSQSGTEKMIVAFPNSSSVQVEGYSYNCSGGFVFGGGTVIGSIRNPGDATNPGITGLSTFDKNEVWLYGLHGTMIISEYK